MIKSIKNALDNENTLAEAAKKTYGKPIQDNQISPYIYFTSNNKVRIKTGYRHSFSFYIVADNMEDLGNEGLAIAALDTLGVALENLLINKRQNINKRIWKVVQKNEKYFADEMIKVIDFTFYYTFN